jgi:hypothetical protein
VDRLVRSLDRVAASVDREQAIAHASASLARLEELLRGLRDGKGSAGKVFTDPALYDRTAQLLDDVHRSWEKIDGLIAATTQIAVRAGELAEAARGRRSEIETLVGQIQLLVMQSNRALDAANESWLLRTNLPVPAAPLPPAVLDLPREAAAEGRP